MAKEKCRECKSTLVLDEENLCAYCELKLGTNDGNVATAKLHMMMHNDEMRGENDANMTTAQDTGIVNERLRPETQSVDCGVCKSIVQEDSEGLFCDVCKTWFHNDCNKTPLQYDLYALLNDAPQNVKWFCDRCIWDIEKWIEQVNGTSKKSTGVRKVHKGLINSHNVTRKEFELNVVAANEHPNGIDYGEENVGNTDGQKDKSYPKEPEIKLENDQEEHEYMDFDYTNNSIDSDEWMPNEEKEDVIKIKTKKKRKKSSSIKINNESTNDLNGEVVTENLTNILDISEENLTNLISEIQTIQKSKHKRSKCSLCPKAFLHLSDCIAHRLKVHNGIEKPYKCSVCEMKFEAKSMRIKHMEKHDGTMKLKCDICDKRLKNRACLMSHLKLFHMDDKFHSCTECDYTSKYRTVLVMHMIREHSFETKHQCKICNGYFVSKRRLISHMSTHNPDKQFPCEICSKKFRTVQLMKKHVSRQHLSEKQFECKECGKKFHEEKYLNRHVLTHLPIEERMYPCDECYKRFNTISGLKNHKEIHAGVTKVICDICGKGLRDPNYLKRHMMMHNNEWPLKCEICGKGFRHSGHLDLHVKYHKKIVIATCPICGFGAPTKYVLNRHMKLVHTNETPFECDVCGNKYKTKGNLSKHKRGIRGSCKGFNSSDSSIQQSKREPKYSNRSYYDEDDSKQEDSPIHFEESYSSAVLTSSVQNHENHPALLLYANSHNSSVYLTPYQGSLIPPNSRGITATIQSSSINY